MADLKWKITKITGTCKDDVEKITYNNEGVETEIEIGKEYSNSISSVKVYIREVTDCKQGIEIKFSASTENKEKTFYVSRRCDEPEPGDCDKPDAVPELDGYINVFASNINATDTPCTYTYLKHGYNYITKTKNITDKATVLWFLANMLSELTPNTDDASTYFALAAQAEGAKNIDDLSSDNNNKVSEIIAEHERRINGAIIYALYKHDNYDDSVSMAANARNKELGTTLRNENFWELEYKDVVHAAKVSGDSSSNYGIDTDSPIRVLPKNFPSIASNGYDYDYIINTIVPYKRGVSSLASNGYQALFDKYYCKEYLSSIIDSDINLVEKVSLFTELESDRLKKTYWRPRPNIVYNYIENGIQEMACDTYKPSTPIEDGSFGIYLASDDDNKYPNECKKLPLYEGDTQHPNDSDLRGFAVGTYYENSESRTRSNCDKSTPQTSFPSGHSALAFLELLAAIEKYGDSMNVNGYTSRIQRMLDYCDNRINVRAHWKTDVIAGKLISSIHIGFLNGFKTFNDLIKGGGGGCQECEWNALACGRFTGGGYAWDDNEGWAPQEGVNGSVILCQYKIPSSCDCGVNDTEVPVFTVKMANEYSSNPDLGNAIVNWVNQNWFGTNGVEFSLSDATNDSDAINQGQHLHNRVSENQYFIVMSKIPKNTFEYPVGTHHEIHFYLESNRHEEGKTTYDHSSFHQH